ncbi:MAG: hypothetical protein K6T55_12375, partial [Syntrophobacterales bacterium]|nr:hypothetical protein [Syntrophobacterales bacterium]
MAEYDYRDAQGRLLYQVVRLEPKTFRQRRPDPGTPGAWIWNLSGVEPVLYRLPELLAADPAAPVFILEGEKDADRLAAQGLITTTNPQGAGKWRVSFNKHFAGRRVIILPDNDQPGRDHAQVVARNLHGVAASVKVLDLPDLPDKGDVSDWLKAGGTAARLLELAEAAPEWTPEVGEAGPRAEIDQVLKSLDPKVSLAEKLSRLAPLAPMLARLSHLEAAAVMETLRERLKLRAADLA